MKKWMNDQPGQAPANTAAPLLQRVRTPKANRVAVPIRICPIIKERFEDLAHLLRKQGLTRPDLCDEAFLDLLMKYEDTKSGVAHE